MSEVFLRKREVMELIRRIYAGDSMAEAELRERYNRALYSYILKRFGGILSTDEIDDVIADTWLKVTERIKRPDGRAQYDPRKGKFDSYLISEAKYIALAALKKQYVSLDAESSYDGEPAIDRIVSESEPGVEDAVLEKEELRLKLDAYRIFLDIAYRCGGHVYQQLAYTLARFLDGCDNGDLPETRLAAIYRVLRDVKFSDIMRSVRENIVNYSHRFSLPSREILEIFNPVEKRLPIRLRELFNRDRNRAGMFEILFEKRACDTCFKDYFLSREGTPLTDETQISKAVSGWIEKLEGRVRVMLGARDARDRDFIAECGLSSGGMLNYENIRRHDGSCKGCFLYLLPSCGKNAAEKDEKHLIYEQESGGVK